MRGKLLLFILIFISLGAVGVFGWETLSNNQIKEEYVVQWLMFSGYPFASGLFDDINNHLVPYYVDATLPSDPNYQVLCYLLNDTYKISNTTIRTGSVSANNYATSLKLYVGNITEFEEYTNKSTTSIAYCGSELGAANACSQVLKDSGSAYWLSANGGDSNLTLDFGSSISFNSIGYNSYFDTRTNYNWTWWGSDDNSSWVKIIDDGIDNTVQQGKYTMFPTVTYRYLRWEITNSTDGYRGGQFWVYDKNITEVRENLAHIATFNWSAGDTNDTEIINTVEGNLICLDEITPKLNRGSIYEMWMQIELVDSTAPTCTINGPADGNSTVEGSIIFNGTSSEAGTSNIYINGTLNSTHSSVAANTWFNHSIVMGDGTWQWTLECCDASSNCANATGLSGTYIDEDFSTNTTFDVGIWRKQITSSNGIINWNSNGYIDVTADRENNIDYYVYNFSEQDGVEFSILDNLTYEYKVNMTSVAANGFWAFKFFGDDALSDSDNSILYFLFDDSNSALLSYFWDNSSTNRVSGSTSNCYILNIQSLLNITMRAGTINITSYNASNLGQLCTVGYDLTAWSFDPFKYIGVGNVFGSGGGMVGTFDDFKFIDEDATRTYRNLVLTAAAASNTAPVVTSAQTNLPRDYANYSSILLNATASDVDTSDVMNCTLWIATNAVYNWTAIGNNTALNYTWTGFTTHGAVNYNYSCTDNASTPETGYSTQYAISYNNNAPAITLIQYGGNITLTGNNNTNIFFNMTLNDYDLDTGNCTFEWNGTTNATYTSLSNNTVVNHTQNTSTHFAGTQAFLWSCYDGYDRTNSTVYYATYLNTACSISAVPGGVANITYQNLTLTLQATFTDIDADTMSSYFYWQGAASFNQTNTSLASGTAVTIVKSLTAHNNYNFSWACEDFYQAANTSTSTWVLTYQDTAATFTQALTTQTVNHISTNLSFDVNCTDLDSDTISYFDNSSLFTINVTTGLISHDPNVSHVGSHEIEIRCQTDYSNTTSTFTYTVTDYTCGNGVLEGSETCDTSDFGSETCASQAGSGYTGYLTCSDDCNSIITSGCIPDEDGGGGSGSPGDPATNNSTNSALLSIAQTGELLKTKLDIWWNTFRIPVFILLLILVAAIFIIGHRRK